MSATLFETITPEEFTAAGGAGARKGQYRQLLEDFVATESRYGRVSTKEDSAAVWARGKKASSISTSLKGARDAKEAPAGFAAIKVSSRDGIVYLENTAVEA